MKKVKMTSSRKKTSNRNKKSKESSAKKNKLSLQPKNIKDQAVTKTQKPFFIIGIGSSAGGLDPITQILKKLPDQLNAAIVIVQHLNSKHKSLLVEILSRSTKIPVLEIKDGIKIQPNKIYIRTKDIYLNLANGKLRIYPKSSKSTELPIDYFFKSLAEEQNTRALGVILSGTATDGTQGLHAIKSEGGITFAQNPNSAKYNGMPLNAISSGAVDFILEPEAIADEIVKLSLIPINAFPLDSSLLTTSHLNINTNSSFNDHSFKKIFTLVKNITHVDFSLYKHKSILRRLSRRLLVLKIKDLSEYASYLEKNPEEAQNLFSELLIHVTKFFRDPESFDYLKKHILPLKLKSSNERTDTFRIWVPGCATGEEVYSIAISCFEYRDKHHLKTPIQIFASDISAEALQKARSGVYGDISKEVRKDRLQHFFDKAEDGYQVKKYIREACIFSKHNIACDPPFAKIDLISCRNVFIYLENDLQKRIFPLFHFALNPNGILWMGKSETIGNFNQLFSLTDKTHKFYQKKNIKTPSLNRFAQIRYSSKTFEPYLFNATGAKNNLSLQQASERVSLLEFVPPNIVINESMEILHVRGKTSPYLELATGQASLNLLKMAQPELAHIIRTCVKSSKEKNKKIRKTDLTIQTSQGSQKINLSVIPFVTSPDSKEQFYSVFFEESKSPPLPSIIDLKKASKEGTLKRKFLNKNKSLSIEQLYEFKNQLSSSHAYQKSLIAELEHAQENLTTYNEELQATNEELTTVNDELSSRNSEMIHLTNDLLNLLENIDIPVVMVGPDSKIRRFTPKASKTLKLISSDIGRPIGDIKSDIGIINLDEIITEVMNTKTIKEVETQDKHGYWYHIQVRPYHTIDNKIEGAVIVLQDIDNLKKAADIILESEEKYRNLLASAYDGIMVINQEGNITYVNPTLEKMFGYNLGELLNKHYDILILNRDRQKHALLHQQYFLIPEQRTMGQLLNIFGRHKNGTEIPVAISLSPVKTKNNFSITCMIRDITEFKKLENDRIQILAQEQHLREVAERANRIKDEFLATLSHELRTPLTTILGWTQFLLSKVDAPEIKDGLTIIEQSSQVQGQLINDLLDVSRIQSGKLPLEFQKLDLVKILKIAVESVQGSATKKNIQINTAIATGTYIVNADPWRLQQIFGNLITNAIKFTPNGGTISIHLQSNDTPKGKQAQVQITDTGIGVKPEFLEHIFDRFNQIDSTSTRIHGGLGLGLSIVRSLVEMHNGLVTAYSDGIDRGTTFTVQLPIDSTKENLIIESPKDFEKKNKLTRLDSKKLLIVDDSADNRLLFSVLLKSVGAEVQVAESVSAAMKILNSYVPDIILSDISMPEEDGFSLLRKIKASEANKEIKTSVIAITAYAGPDDVRRIIDSGFSAHIAKPVVWSELTKIIADTLNLKQ